MQDGEREEMLQQVKALEWTEEIRPQHPWTGDILIRRKDVEAILRGERPERDA